MRKQVSFKAVQAFEAAARFSSFALAAEELFVTPSAVSHQIRFLEEQFGVLLFHRLHRGVVLTDAGRLYAKEISAAFVRIEAATRDLGRLAKSGIPPSPRRKTSRRERTAKSPGHQARIRQQA